MKLYKFGLPAILAIAFVCTAQYSFATVLSSWAFPDFANLTAASGPAIASDAGVFASSFQGVHASSATVWSSPAGNASPDSYSGNTWAVNDYFQITTSSLGYDTLTLTFDGTGSNTGPKDFKVAASTDGTVYTDIGFTYILTNDSWSSGGSPKPESTRTTPLPAAFANQANLYIRLINTTTTSINGGTTATAGTSRIDNVIVDGTLIPTVPEPASIALLGLTALGLLIRRK